ncbi:MAG: metallophosphoesterase [Bacteroidia bacterium]|nr:metallophosphoesterase [Bacteroidia bacterium]
MNRKTLLCFICCLLAQLIFYPSAAKTIIAKTAVWKYLDNGTTPPTGWNSYSFSDATWKSGAAELGFGDAPATTLLSSGITAYFRKKFTLYNPSQYASFSCRLRRDDGIVVYLNGAEVYRNNMPAGSISGTTTSVSSCSDDGNTILVFNVPLTAFNSGGNVMAAEVHNVSAGSTDLTFELELLGQLPAVLPVITRGPYIQSVTQQSALLHWRTNVPSDTKVSFGIGSNCPFTVTDTSMKTEHEICITGLQPNTKYFYKIGSTALVMQKGQSNYFYTAPYIGTVQPVRVWALGDFGNGSTEQGQVLQSYLNYLGPVKNDMWIWLGDNAYNTGTDQEYTAYVFNVYGSIFKNWNFYPAPGNHDYGQSGYQSAAALGTNFPYFSIFNLPVSAEAGGVASGTEKYYSYDWSNIHFIALDSYGALNHPGSPMYNWLQNDLQQNQQKWIIAYFHHPPFSKGTHNSDTEIEMMNMRQNIVPLLEQYGVDLVLSGHSHTYERSYFMHGHYGPENTFAAAHIVQPGNGAATPYMKDAQHNGTVYAVCGVGGKTSAATTSGYPHNAMVASYNSLAGSVVLDIYGDTLRYKFLKSDGSIPDEFVMVKTGQPRVEPATTVTDAGILVVPNPGSGIVQVRVPENLPGHLKIFDLRGRLVLSDELFGSKTMELEFLPVGVYHFVFENAQGLFRQKVVMSR